jgi:CHAD domain-containing protein
MKDSKLLLRNFEKLWEKYSKRLINCQQTGSEEAIHKLRISCRRLLAIIALLQALDHNASLGKLRKHIKTQLDNFDELRDTQVMLIEIADKLDSCADMARYHSYLKNNEQRLLTAIPNLLNFPPKSLFKKTRNSLCLDAIPIKHHIPAVIDATYQTALDRYQRITPDNPSTLHRLRIALKKLRYMLSASADFLSDLPPNHLRSLQIYLTRLGEIQNSCVLLDSLNRFFGHQLPESVQHYYTNRHQVLINDFMLHKTDILTFWRADEFSAQKTSDINP